MNVSSGQEATGIQLQVEMSLESHRRLQSLVASLEAATLGEVIRRAMLALEMVEPVYVGKKGAKVAIRAAQSAISRPTKRLHVRVNEKTKRRLDELQTETGLTYSELLNQGLDVLTELKAALEDIVSKGKENGVSKDHQRDRPPRRGMLRNRRLLLAALVS